MRLLRKILINLTVVALLLLLLYCIQTSNGVNWSEHYFRLQNASEKTNFSSAVVNSRLRNNLQPIFINTTKIGSVPKVTNYYNVWCIFTKVTTNSPMRRKFRIFTDSLLRLASVDIAFHVITDNESRSIAEVVIQGVMSSTQKFMKVQYYDVHKLAKQLEYIVLAMSPHFSSKPGTYYSDALFFLSLGLHQIAPEKQKLAVMLDADTKFRSDVRDLFEEFKHFGPQALFGLAPELTPVYRHVLYSYRNQNPKTIFGEPISLGGYPGYNSGVVLFQLERLRKSPEWDQIISEDMVNHMTEKYSFKGHLGDQDFYTLLGMERPELIHTVDCGWNRQLCTWWRDRGYIDVFANYSQCDSETKLWHGNCNTPIPEED
ncbi:xyloside xylosyltransferase 1-like [Venturia canescens]|uniref:xyloside xylosyltransferase 1-like n=1 Tax=Venturia canescens TaxID=32260 RepID=UPI001C9CA618|nr:xyloside xylosyltransferase 1-like [Venturia canescens]